MNQASKTIMVATAFGLFFSGAVYAANQPVPITDRISTSTGSSSGAWNTDCEQNFKPKMADLGVAVTCVPSKGSIQNMKDVNAGTVEMGYVQTDLLYLAWQNADPNATNLNPGGRTYINESLMCATANGAITGFKSLKDLGRPATIVTPPVGSGSEGTMRFLRDNLPGYKNVINITPQEVKDGDKYSMDRAISALQSRNPAKRADAVCWVERPTDKSENLTAVANNADLHLIPMDEPTIMDLAFEGTTVYTGIANVYAGKGKTIDALQIGDTYIYNDKIPSGALKAVAKVIDQDPNYIDQRTLSEKMSKLWNKATSFTANVAKNAKKAGTAAYDAANKALN